MSSRIYKYENWMIRALIQERYIGTYIPYSEINDVIKPVYVGPQIHVYEEGYFPILIFL